MRSPNDSCNASKKVIQPTKKDKRLTRMLFIIFFAAIITILILMYI